MTLTTLDPRTALVVIDLQAGILRSPTAPYDAQQVLSRSVTLAAAFRDHGLPVVLVRVVDLAPGRTEMPRHGGFHEGWDVLAEELTGHPEDVVVTKRTAGAFYGTDLDLQLRRRGVTQVVLCGISTSMGVESTARGAHERGYNVTLAVDAMADREAATHEHSVTKVFPRLGETGTTGEVVALLSATRAGG